MYIPHLKSNVTQLYISVLITECIGWAKLAKPNHMSDVSSIIAIMPNNNGYVGYSLHSLSEN